MTGKERRDYILTELTESDTKKYLNNLKCGKSISLMTVTSGYHYHTICAETDERLDEIQEALSKLGYLAKLQEYEPFEF